jgi:DNA invertase Pin-like site-specific DNA recombinase
MPQSSNILRYSMEYLMPKRKERMASYIRESDPRLANSTTIESQAKVVREYGEKEGYIYSPTLEFREAISAYEIPYTERKQLLRMLDAAKRKEFDVLVVSEVRAIGRRQVEVLVIYDMLQKYGIRLETVKEKFGEDAMSKAILSLRTMFVEIEVEQSKMRMMRGRADRIAIGGAPNAHPKAAYGYIFVDTDREVKGAYEFNHKIIYVDKDGNEWSEYKVVVFIFDLLKKGLSIGCVVRTLNEIGIPTAKKALNGNPHWQRGSLYRIIINPIYMGEVWANRFNGVKNKTGISSFRPREEWIRLPDAPAIVSKEDFEFVQRQLQANKEESMRNNSHPREELGLLRSGYIFCAVCGRGMRLSYPAKSQRHDQTPLYTCQNTERDKSSPAYHRTNIHIVQLDKEVIKKIIEILTHPSWIREWVAERKKKEEPIVTEEDIAATIENIRRSMQNIYNLAEKATDDETIAHLTQRMNALELQKRQAESMLFDLEDESERQAKLEEEIIKFEKWAEQVRPLLTDCTYVPSWEELRLAIRILGIRVTVYPTKGDYPYRHQIDVTIPEIMKKIDVVSTTKGG